MKLMEDTVDIFLTWVDGDDQEWNKMRQKYAVYNNEIQARVNGIQRYRNWNNLKYIFRGIELYMPWVRKVYFVTCGQIPDFLNVKNEKLVIINHEDYIPKYLPTFNSNTIEMNLFRIKGIAQNVLLFNDDTFVIEPIPKSYFIKNGKPCDEAIERIIGRPHLIYSKNMINNAWIINKYFDKKKVKKENWIKWYNVAYGKDIIRNIIMNYFNMFEGLRNPHEPFLLRKDICEKIWEYEPELLDIASNNKFRNESDVTQYVIRYWNIFEGNFIPRKHKGKAFTVSEQNYKEIADAIRTKKFPLVSVDENADIPLEKFEIVRDEINSAFESVMPQKSSFEK